MNDFDVHVCLVSEQAAPNLLPVLDDQWRPQKVVLAASPRMRREASALRDVIKGKGHGIQVEILDLPDAYDYQSLTDAFLEFLAAHENERVALNVTGGTKLMAVAAQQAFSACNKAVLYVNVETDEVIVIGKGKSPRALQAKLKVNELLRAHGFSLTAPSRPEIPAELRDLAARVIDRAGTYGAALGQLNALAASESAKKSRVVELNDSQRGAKPLQDVMALFEDAGQLSVSGRHLRFSGERERAFVNGGWLEWAAYSAIRDLQGKSSGITDVVMNAVFTHPDGKTVNEVDVLFLYRNTLHLIECKTANLAAEGAGNDNKATESVYKLEALRKVGGLRTRCMILDYRGALSAHQANLDRARSSDIQVVSGRQLTDLRGVVRRVWLGR